MNIYWFSLICWLVYMALYLGISFGIPRIRRSFRVVWLLHKIDREARALFYYGMVFFVVLVPCQAVLTAQLITRFWN